MGKNTKKIGYENNGCISKALLVEETKLMPFNWKISLRFPLKIVIFPISLSSPITQWTKLPMEQCFQYPFVYIYMFYSHTMAIHLPLKRYNWSARR